mmetsp:Transcript_11423/g.25985  ORF Transcript_11423/g.25985 Transcript_11423/m.25985 type:complete len:181 (-) Transcript_11423:32-574(-)
MHKKRLNFDPHSKWRILRECAVGLNVLHVAPVPVVHRDIKSLNVLLTKQFTVKICDFGLSKIMTKQTMQMTKGLGTPHWMAPEVISSSNYGTPSDVYSYGIMVWELFHRMVPYGGLDAAKITMGVVTGNPPLRPPIHRNIQPNVARLMNWCWDQKPENRPSFARVIEYLDQIQGEFPQQH